MLWTRFLSVMCCLQPPWAVGDLKAVSLPCYRLRSPQSFLSLSSSWVFVTVLGSVTIPCERALILSGRPPPTPPHQKMLSDIPHLHGNPNYTGKHHPERGVTLRCVTKATGCMEFGSKSCPHLSLQAASLPQSHGSRDQ